MENELRGTTICAVKRNGKTAIAGRQHGGVFGRSRPAQAAGFGRNRDERPRSAAGGRLYRSGFAPAFGAVPVRRGRAGLNLIAAAAAQVEKTTMKV